MGLLTLFFLLSPLHYNLTLESEGCKLAMVCLAHLQCLDVKQGNVIHAMSQISKRWCIFKSRVCTRLLLHEAKVLCIITESIPLSSLYNCTYTVSTAATACVIH